MGEKMSIIREPVLSMTRRTCEKLICEPDGNAARLWLLLAAEGDFSETEAAGRLGISQNAVRAAFAALSRAGLSSGSLAATTDPDVPLTAKDARARKDSDEGFAFLVSYAEQTLGRTLTASDLTALLRITERYGLMQESVVLLLSFCGKKADPDGTSGRRTTMYQVEKVAQEWERQGVDTPEKVDEFVRQESVKNDRIRNFLRSLNVYSCTPGVEKTVEKWLASGLPEDVLVYACDLTVTKTGSLKWNYADSIVSSWVSKGLRTVADIKREDHPAARTKTKLKSGDELERKKEQIRRSIARAAGSK